MTLILRWLLVLIVAAIAGKLVSKIKLPSILGWLIVGMFFGPHAIGLLPQKVLDAGWYKIIIMWMQCAFGLMLGTELVWKKMKTYGKALIITTLTQSLGTFFLVTAVFAAIFAATGVPVYLALVFGGIALATAPAPALSIVSEFHANGPVAGTLLPMAVLDDMVAIVVFFTVNSFVASSVSGGLGAALYDSGYDIFADYNRNCNGASCRISSQKGKRTCRDACGTSCGDNNDGGNRICF